MMSFFYVRWILLPSSFYKHHLFKDCHVYFMFNIIIIILKALVFVKRYINENINKEDTLK